MAETTTARVPTRLALLEFGELLGGLEIARTPPTLDPKLGPECERLAADWLLRYVPYGVLEDAAARHPTAKAEREAVALIRLEVE